MSDAPTTLAPRPTSRFAFLGPCAGILLVCYLAILVAWPRVPAVWSFRLVPSTVRTADGRPVVPETIAPQPHIFLPDPDDYTRVYRAERIADGSRRRWGVMNEINAPEGIELHWTAPMDYLTAGAGLLGQRFWGNEDGFVTGAAMLPQVMGIAYLILMAAFVRRVSNWTTAILCAALCAVSPPFQRVFELGHADHHCLLEVLLLGSALFITPRPSAVEGPSPFRRHASYALSGILMGLALWTASQAMVFWFVFIFALCVAAFLNRTESKADSFECAFGWNATISVVIAIACLIDGGAVHPKAGLDRLNLAMVSLAMATSSFIQLARIRLTGTALKTRTGRNLRIVMAIGAVVLLVPVAIAATASLNQLNAPALARWHDQVAELQPMVSIAAASSTTADAPPISLEPLYNRLGCVAYLLPIALPFFAMTRTIPTAVRWLLGILAPALVTMSLFQLRWMDHVATFVFPVIVIGLYEAFDRLGRALPKLNLTPTFRAGALLAILGATTIPFMTWSRLGLVASANAAASADPALADARTEAVLRALAPREDQIRTDFVARAIALLEKQSPSPSGRRTILCEEGEGPTLLYETGLPVVAAPYHRAIGGIIDMMEFFAERDPSKARERLDRRQVRYLVVPWHVNEQLMNFEEIALGGLRSFDPPIETLDSHGRLQRQLRYRPEVMQTMAYRLAMKPRDHGIPGVELLYGICDDPKRPEDVHGLLFVVHDLPSTGTAPNG